MLIAMLAQTTMLTAQTVTDIDGNVYNTVLIGDQVWMAENLRTSRYADATSIPNVTGDVEWENLNSGAWVHYDNDATNETPYGKLYNWFAVADTRGLCPEGWHVPSDGEWSVLSYHLGGSYFAGGKLKATGTEYWASPNEGATNESGFTAYPSGARFELGSFSRRGLYGYFWSSTEFTSDFAWIRNLPNDDTKLIRYNSVMVSGLSVRCLREDPLTLSDVEVTSVASTSATARSTVLGDGGASVSRRRPALDDYGAESPAELFAVAVESFFETPDELRRQYPALLGVEEV